MNQTSLKKDGQDADQRSKYPTPTLPKGEGDLAYNIGETFANRLYIHGILHSALLSS